MLFTDLFVESKNWQDIENPADRWLAKYTYENLDKYPSEKIVSELIRKYPASAGVIYRGMNFYTKENFDEFMEQFGDKKTANLELTGVTSWTKDEQSSEQFAITQPTYHLNYQVMAAYEKQKASKERLSGYRGIILSTSIKDGQAIDVNASKLGHESEVILPRGTYTISIHRFIKKYSDQLADRETTVDKVVQAATKEDTYKDDSFYNYVMHHHGKELNSKSRDHLFFLFKPNQGQDLFRYDVHESSFVKDGFQVNCGSPAYRLFTLYRDGVFKKPQQIAEIKKMAEQVTLQMEPVIREYFVKATNMTNPAYFIQIANIAGASSAKRIYKLMTDQLGEEYRRLNSREEIKKINDITDDRKKRQAIEDLKEKTRILLQKLQNLAGSI